MAFDLAISGFKGKAGQRVRTRLQKLVARSGGESWGGVDSFGIGIGRLSGKKTEKFYKALVTMAKSEGLSIYDPQAGKEVDLSVPGRLPPGWEPPEPANSEYFEKRVRRFTLDHLKPLGFIQGQYGAERLLDGGHLLQRLTFCPNKDLFKVVVDWRFIFEGEEDPSWPTPIDISDYIVGTALEREWPVAFKAPRWGWLSATESELERSLKFVDRAIVELVEPVLITLNSIESLVVAFEEGRLGRMARRTKVIGQPPHDAFYITFGYSPIGAARNMALSYKHLGRLAEGKKRYYACMDKLGSFADLIADTQGLSEAEALFES